MLVRTRIARVLVAASLGVVMSPVSSATARPLYTHFLFFPSHEMETEVSDIDGIRKKDVFVTVGSGKIHGWFFRNPESPYVVLVNHGNAGNITHVEWIARNVLSTGVSVMVYDYRGYGLSDGEPTAESICTDGDAVYDYLVTQEKYAPNHIILYGQSLGCAVACHIAGAHQIGALILQSGFSSLRRVAYQRFPILKHAPSSLVPDVLDNRAIVERLHVPLLVIHGDCDRVVPFCNANDLYDAAAAKNKKLVVCPNGGHRLFPHYDSMHRAALQEFIDQFKHEDSAPRASMSSAGSNKVQQTVALFE